MHDNLTLRLPQWRGVSMLSHSKPTAVFRGRWVPAGFANMPLRGVVSGYLSRNPCFCQEWAIGLVPSFGMIEHTIGSQNTGNKWTPHAPTSPRAPRIEGHTGGIGCIIFDGNVDKSSDHRLEKLAGSSALLVVGHRRFDRYMNTELDLADAVP